MCEKLRTLKTQNIEKRFRIFFIFVLFFCRNYSGTRVHAAVLHTTLITIW